MSIEKYGILDYVKQSALKQLEVEEEIANDGLGTHVKTNFNLFSLDGHSERLQRTLDRLR